MFPFPESWKRPQSDARGPQARSRLASPDARRHAGRGPRGGPVLTALRVLGGGALRVLRVKAEPGSWNTSRWARTRRRPVSVFVSCRGREDPMPPPVSLRVSEAGDRPHDGEAVRRNHGAGQRHAAVADYWTGPAGAAAGFEKSPAFTVEIVDALRCRFMASWIWAGVRAAIFDSRVASHASVRSRNR